jgi:hypothetical protein
MIPSAIGQLALRLEVQLLINAVAAINITASNNNFFIVIIWG